MFAQVPAQFEGAAAERAAEVGAGVVVALVVVHPPAAGVDVAVATQCRVAAECRDLVDVGHRQFRAVVTEEQRSEEHTSELQSLMRISYAVLCLKQKKHELG